MKLVSSTEDLPSCPATDHTRIACQFPSFAFFFFFFTIIIIIVVVVVIIYFFFFESRGMKKKTKRKV
jgi:heme/copper-type cytochrome/quinol oxidase subunit 2